MRNFPSAADSVERTTFPRRSRRVTGTPPAGDSSGVVTMPSMVASCNCARTSARNAIAERSTNSTMSRRVTAGTVTEEQPLEAERVLKHIY